MKSFYSTASKHPHHSLQPMSSQAGTCPPKTETALHWKISGDTMTHPGTGAQHLGSYSKRAVFSWPKTKRRGRCSRFRRRKGNEGGGRFISKRLPLRSGCRGRMQLRCRISVGLRLFLFFYFVKVRLTQSTRKIDPLYAMDYPHQRPETIHHPDVPLLPPPTPRIREAAPRRNPRTRRTPSPNKRRRNRSHRGQSPARN